MVQATKTIDFPVRNRWSGEIQFTAKIEADDTTSTGFRIGLAVKWAIGSRADLSGADLSGADLSRADLSGADLSGADLSEEALRLFRADMWLTLTEAEDPNEIRFLIAALKHGAVDGSTYGDGKSCACLVGTLARFKGEGGEELDHSSDRPAERWFMMIRVGDTPGKLGDDGKETGGGFAARKALEWAEGFCKCAGIDPEFPASVEVPNLGPIPSPAPEAV